MQETIDGLNEEFAVFSTKSLETTSYIKDLEHELLNQTELLKTLPEGTSEHAQQKNIIRETTTKITVSKANLNSYALKKSNCLQRLELFKKQLEEKKQQFEQRNSRSDAARKQTNKPPPIARKVSQQPEQKESSQPRKVSSESKGQKKKAKK